MATTDVLWPPPGPRSVVVRVRDAKDAAARADLCARVRRLLSSGKVDVVSCDLTDAGEPDLAVVDALARLQLTARRLGGDIRLRAVTYEVRQFLSLAGLNSVLGRDERSSSVESRG